MTETAVLVYVDLEGVSCLVGRLWNRVRKNKETVTFEYDDGWLEHPARFSLEPALKLGPGPFHADKALFGAMGDSAPDRWGRVLMRRAERRRARTMGTAPRTLREIDFLLGVNDELRQGALRFSETEGGPFLANAEAASVPPLVELPRLLSASEHVLNETESDEDLRLLLAPGSSLGGARPKVSIRVSDRVLAIAKFPHQDDDVDTVRWEAVALRLAKKAGISVPTWRLETIGGKPVLVSHRFDRVGNRRIPFLSGMSMLQANDHETRSYLELVDALRQNGASPEQDMCELWRRLVFNVMISNTDDHLRNHGFLYQAPKGWRLAPAYDLNPTPTDVRPRALSTAIDLENTAASLKLALDVASYFELSSTEAGRISSEVGRAVEKWRFEAVQCGISRSETERMASAFEHEDLKAACR